MIDLPLLGQEPAQGAAPGKAPKAWRSPEAFRRGQSAEALPGDAHEFAADAAAAPSQANRRQFLQVMGASVALAGLTACRRPVEYILPYTRKPEDVIEGISQYYATAMPFRGVLSPLLVESREGRPVKVEGNPEHPVSLGASGVFEQASVLQLYDPDRSRRVRRGDDDSSWSNFVQAAQSLAGPTVVLAEPSSSPTVARLRTQLAARFPGLRWVTYRPEGDDAFALATTALYGRPLRPAYDFAQADVVVSLEGDFLGTTDTNEVANSRSFAQARTPERGRMLRMYAVESHYTTTGGTADHRLRLKPSRVSDFAAALAGRVGVGGAPAGPAFGGRDAAFLDALAEDVRGKRVVVIAGPTQPAHVHALALRMTAALGGLGTAMRLLDTGEAAAPPQGNDLAALTNAMRAGAVQNLLMIGVNPVYDAPGALRFAEALTRVPVSIHVGHHIDETAAKSSWHLPRAHYLEAWGDGRSYDGTLALIQPIVAPLNERIDSTNPNEPARERDDIHSDVEIVNLLATRADAPGYDVVRETWRTAVTGDFEKGWRRVLHDGFLPDTAFAAAGVGAPGAGALPIPARPESGVEVSVRLSPRVLDGSYANVSWLQELPDMVSKLVWDNAAYMSRATAERLGLAVEYDSGRYSVDRAELAVGGRKVELPVWILPGHADDAITVEMGYGRQIATTRAVKERPGLLGRFNTDFKTDMYWSGPLANGVGENVAPLREANFAPVVTASVRKASAGYTLVTTQEAGVGSDMNDRPLILEATFDEYRANPAFVKEREVEVPGGGLWDEQEALWGQDRHPRNQDFYKDNPYNRNQWGMVVDLTTCTGCSACVIACQAENNVQVVGKEQVSKGREMHWLRMDRYFIGQDQDNPRMAFQWLACVHCENAPCESVCPVAATYHSPDGMNHMVYNRCIGTRYCSNNCPYKVRRFNWFNWTHTLPLQVQMQQNPDVTVRSRGVMEKCSFCVQRVREVNDRVTIEARGIREGEVQTACQQACAAGAITFGDLNNAESAVLAAKRNPRRYDLLAELGTRPRVSYLGRVRNPNPRLEPAEPKADVAPTPATERDDIGGSPDAPATNPAPAER